MCVQNPKGVWRKTSLSSYRSKNPQWKHVLDIDALGKEDSKSWVYKGNAALPRSRDPAHSRDRVTRTLIKLSDGGADAVTVREFDLVTNCFVPEDEGGFVISKEAKTTVRYKSRDILLVGSNFGEGSLTDSGYPRQVKEWRRGTKLEDAKLVFEGEKTDVSVGMYVDDQMHRGGHIYEFRYRSLDFYNTKKWVKLVEFDDLLSSSSTSKDEDCVELDVPTDADVNFFGGWMLITLKSDWKLENQTYEIGSLIAVRYDSYAKSGKNNCDFQILFKPTKSTALESYRETKNYLILDVMDNVKSKLLFLNHDPDNGKFNLVSGKEQELQIRSSHVAAFDSREGDLFWFTSSTYTQPTTLYLADAGKMTEQNIGAAGKDPFITEQLKSLPPQYNSENMDVQQRFATSKDGTQVPYFLVCPKGGFKPNTPTLLYGYGGFQISLGPHYAASTGIAWLERGGAFVEANIRGGGEFGPSWHKAALRENRNKAYEDFIAVAEDLISSGLCSSSTLGIRGGSNGGLLVGNMYTMRPDLFGAVHCAVPLLDMKKFNTLLAGASWMAEYGNPDTEDWDTYLHRYSPYHNIDPEAAYPPILVTTSTRDDRVHPAHARKMVKKLWDLDKDKKWRVYYYENIEGGHGGAADSKQSAFMTALAYDFLWNTLNENRIL